MNGCRKVPSLLELKEVRLPSDEKLIASLHMLRGPHLHSCPSYAEARAIAVRSSDHNPVTVKLRVP